MKSEKEIINKFLMQCSKENQRPIKLLSLQSLEPLYTKEEHIALLREHDKRLLSLKNKIKESFVSQAFLILNSSQLDSEVLDRFDEFIDYIFKEEKI